MWLFGIAANVKPTTAAPFDVAWCWWTGCDSSDPGAIPDSAESRAMRTPWLDCPKRSAIS